MNSAVSERMEDQLQSLGSMPFVKDDHKGGKNKSDRSKPDVVVLNTCLIRNHAEQKVYSYIGLHAKRKRDGEDVTIVVAGCAAQQEGEDLLRRAPAVDIAMGPQVCFCDYGMELLLKTSLFQSIHLFCGFMTDLNGTPTELVIWWKMSSMETKW